jgi:hypothetical protein
MTDLLTPEEVREILEEFKDEKWVVTVPADGFNGLCRDYLTLWDCNKELEFQVMDLAANLDMWKCHALGNKDD